MECTALSDRHSGPNCGCKSKTPCASLPFKEKKSGLSLGRSLQGALLKEVTKSLFDDLLDSRYPQGTIMGPICPPALKEEASRASAQLPNHPHANNSTWILSCGRNQGPQLSRLAEGIKGNCAGCVSVNLKSALVFVPTSPCIFKGEPCRNQLKTSWVSCLGKCWTSS